MTKPTGVGRGGPRKNSGRPPKAKPKKVASTEEAMTALVGLGAMPAPPFETLQDVAFWTLNEVMVNAEHDAPRVSAARAVLAEAARRAGGAKSGKKGERADAAKAQNAGRFATPSGPRLAIDNT
jgi:hypothetical protein